MDDAAPPGTNRADTETGPLLGRRLRALRNEHGLSLRELGARANVSPAMLSQVENGATDPSLTTLRRLASVFNSSVAALFTEPDAPTVHVSRAGSRPGLLAPHGKVLYERLTPGRGDLEVLRARLAPGESSSDSMWAHASTECAVVLAGTLDVHVGDEVETVTTGDAITFDSRLPHRYVNDHSTDVVYLLSVTPPTP